MTCEVHRKNCYKSALAIFMPIFKLLIFNVLFFVAVMLVKLSDT